MVKGTVEPPNVRNDTSAHHQHRLVPRDTGGLEVNNNFLHVVDVLVRLVNTVDELM